VNVEPVVHYTTLWARLVLSAILHFCFASPYVVLYFSQVCSVSFCPRRSRDTVRTTTTWWWEEYWKLFSGPDYDKTRGRSRRGKCSLDDDQVGVIGPEEWLLTSRLTSTQQGWPKLWQTSVCYHTTRVTTRPAFRGTVPKTYVKSGVPHFAWNFPQISFFIMYSTILNFRI
jgi:hypothetical protein